MESNADVVASLARDPVYIKFELFSQQAVNAKQAIFEKLGINIRDTVGKEGKGKQEQVLLIPGYWFWEMSKILIEKGLTVATSFEIERSLPVDVEFRLELRPYQKELLNQWRAQRFKGVIKLPTGAGKTMLAIAAIRELQATTLILVPTLTLLEQWKSRAASLLSLPGGKIGVLGGGLNRVGPITIATYQSALLKLHRLRTRFGFLIADEAHHLPSPEYAKIPQALLSPYRMGLTATPERADEQHVRLNKLLGPLLEIEKASIASLQDKGYLADHRLEKIEVKLLPEEQEKYDTAMRVYTSYLRKHRGVLRSGRDFERLLVFRANNDPEARQALKAHREARRIALGSRAKLKALTPLLKRHWRDGVIIFCEYTDTALEIAKEFTLPLITNETSAWERNELLKAFQKGIISVLVTGRVLDEGWDVRNARVGIIISGSAQKRQFIQRLGRLLRPEPGKEAILYEIISKSTSEGNMSRRRKKTMQRGD